MRPGTNQASTSATIKVTDSSVSPKSQIITINVGTVTVLVNAETPTINKHPQDAVYDQNAIAAALTVEATVSDGGTLSYQWYDEEENPILGATESTYVPSTATAGTYMYFCEVINTRNDVNSDKVVEEYSDVATIVVKGTSPSGEATKPQEETRVFEDTLDKYQNEINHARAGSTVVIKGDEGFNALPESIISSFLKKGDVNLEFSYSYQGKAYKITIPAGSKIESGIPWYGPMYLFAHFGNRIPQSEAKVLITTAERTALYQKFDSELYAGLYADVVKVYGRRKSALFRHFISYGMVEGRRMSVEFAGAEYLEVLRTQR